MERAECGRRRYTAWERVPDPRARRGRRHPVAAVFARATAAMLANARSLYAIAQWGRVQEPDRVRALGFTRARTPTVSTLHEVFKALDVQAFERALSGWAQEVLSPSSRVIALDGKALREAWGPARRGVARGAAGEWL